MGLLGSILGGKSRVQLIQNNNTVIQFDASIKENHQRESPPTEFPVEDGTVISDHIIIKPFQLELTGIISDTPIGGIQGLITEASSVLTSSLLPPVGVIAGSVISSTLFSALASSSSPSVAAYGQLLQLQENALPVDVITSLQRYENMWIKSISAPRDADTGKALIFTVTLTQLLLVTPQSVNIQVFANPGLSANQADMGEGNSGLPNGFPAGYNKSQGDLSKLVAGGSH